MKINNFFKCVIAVVVTQFAGIIGSFFTVSAIPTWYTTIQRSQLNPPNWIFGPVWTTLYFLMGISAFLIWKKGFERKEVRNALYIFAFQLALNTLWSIIFFGLHSLRGAFIEIIILWLVIIWTMVAFYKISRPAAYLLLPYITWVTFASYLSYSVMVLN
ncbi:MAG: TspO/MBR family protein [Candidatus Paceibacterota bacterium]